MFCNFKSLKTGRNVLADDQDVWECQNRKCGYIFPRGKSRYPDKPPGWQCLAKGPGDHLHESILKWTGETVTKTCACKNRIKKMNQWGPRGCRRHLREIVGWLRGEARKRRWWRYAVTLPGARFFIRRLVLDAIRRAEME